MNGTTHASVEHIQPPAPASGRPGAMPAGPAPGWHPDNVLSVLAAGAVALAVWPVLLALHGPQPLRLPVLVAHVAGMLAGYGVVVLIALMSRTPALERGVGADRLARWHGRGG